MMTEVGPSRDRGGPVVAAGPILVVDDDAQLQKTIRWLLEDEGLSVETASSGEEALSLAGRRRPALVILDLNLPALDGEGVVHGLRAIHGSNVRILVVSSDVQIEQRAHNVGAWAWMSKPFEVDELLASVWQALAIHQA